LRTKPSIADESGGEEILYPRNPATVILEPSRLRNDQRPSFDDTPKVARAADRSLTSDKALTSPPSAFSQPIRSARKRTSDEFEFDQTGALVSKYASSSSSSAKDKGKEEKGAAARRHRSLNAGSISSRDGKTKERRRESSGITLNNIPSSSASIRSPEKHTRQPSAGSTTSSFDASQSRRVQTTDFTYLPASPSSTSIQHLLRTPNAASGNPSSLSKDNLHAHASTNVAHSLLSGTQEGWSALGDEEAAEALRKLDGLSGKGARAKARASVGSFGRPSSSSRPVTPANKAGSQWDGLSASDSAKSKHGSKDNVSSKDVPRVNHNLCDGSAVATSSDDQHGHVALQEKTPKKSTAVKLSFTPKRGSTSSTTYTSTPSSRDSASMSATTSITSMSAASGRQSSSKGRRNSAGSDISSIHSSEALKDRVALIALNGDVADDGEVPPVPPLPKDLSNYRSPPSTSAGYSFPSMPSDEKDKTPRSEAQSNRSISLDVPPSPIVVSPPAPTSGRRDSQNYSTASGSDSLPVVRTPSKKWSFSNALNKLGSPSSSSQKSSFPLSPRAAFGHQLRKSASKDQRLHTPPTNATQWSANHPAAMTSVHSLASVSSVNSVMSPTQVSVPSKTPDHGPASSRPGTGSSISTNNTTSALSAPQGDPSVKRTHSKRLTPSSIPFFSRRSSSHSMHMPPPPPPVGVISSISPIIPSSAMLSAHTPRKQGGSPSQDFSAMSISTSTPGTTHKKSMLSLGLPSLLKSSSRRSLHSDAKDSDKESQKAKAAAKEAEKARNKLEKLRKDDKDRSESRISVIINRKRGKVCPFLLLIELTLIIGVDSVLY